MSKAHEKPYKKRVEVCPPASVRMKRENWPWEVDVPCHIDYMEAIGSVDSIPISTATYQLRRFRLTEQVIPRWIEIEATEKESRGYWHRVIVPFYAEVGRDFVLSVGEPK